MVSYSALSSLVAWRAFTSIIIIALVPIVHTQPTLPLLLSSQELVYGTIYWQQIGEETHKSLLIGEIGETIDVVSFCCRELMVILHVSSAAACAIHGGDSMDLPAVGRATILGPMPMRNPGSAGLPPFHPLPHLPARFAPKDPAPH